MDVAHGRLGDDRFRAAKRWGVLLVCFTDSKAPPTIVWLESHGAGDPRARSATLTPRRGEGQRVSVYARLGHVSDPSGGAPELLWPVRLVRPAARTVYLDLNHWIGLSQAAAGHREGSQYRETLEACRAATQAGVLFPMSSVSYIEVSKIKHPRQRADLARVIEELSSFCTILSHPLIVTMELDAAISDALGVPSPDQQDLAYLGTGVGYAFGVVLTPTLSGPTDDERTGQADSQHRPDILKDMMRDLERFALRGPQDENEAADLRRLGWDPKGLFADEGVGGGASVTG